MVEIQVSIEGDAAVEATQELFDKAGISGKWNVVGGNEKEGTLATIAIIVGIVAGVVQTADIIYKWYQEYSHGKSGKKIQKVLIVGRSGKRLLLENATIKQIQKILEDELSR